jgi:hypothetical protein
MSIAAKYPSCSTIKFYLRSLKMSKVTDTAHEIAKDLYQAGIIDGTTMREYNTLCIPPVKEFTASETAEPCCNKRIANTNLKSM